MAVMVVAAVIAIGAVYFAVDGPGAVPSVV